MEALRELASLQTAIHVLARHSLALEDTSDNQFLAKFFVFAAQNCKDAQDMSTKCRILSRTLEQMASKGNIFEELDSEISSDINSPPFKDSDSEKCEERETISITYRDLERSKSTLEDFCRSYFMFHNMDADNCHDIFKHLPILVFVESYIYQIDEHKEELLQPLYNSSHRIRDTSKCVQVTNIEGNCFQPLQTILADLNISTKRIDKELQSGMEYWSLEQSLCSSLMKEEKIMLSDVMKAIKLKSFDYRVLNLLLYQLLNQPVNEMHMEFLSASELLVEISDDLFDYEEDVLNNSFNILRMFVRIYGSERAPSMLAQLISEVEENYKTLLANLEPHLASEYQKRCQIAAVEGGATLSPEHPMGSWVIPPLIVNETLYREQVMSCQKC